jgi:RNase P/RNase MRP subunit p30
MHYLKQHKRLKKKGDIHLKMIDIVIPNRNEEEFIARAKTLGYSGLIFLYIQKDIFYGIEKSKAGSEEGFKCSAGLMVDSTKAKSLQSYSEAIKACGLAVGRGFSQQLFESKAIRMIFELETQKRDFSTFRNSGLNQVLSMIAKKKGMEIGFSISEILEASAEERADIIGRMMQNLWLCEKYEVKMRFASFAKEPMLMRSICDIKSLMRCIGAGERAIKQAL